MSVGVFEGEGGENSLCGLHDLNCPSVPLFIDAPTNTLTIYTSLAVTRFNWAQFSNTLYIGLLSTYKITHH